MNRRVPHHNLPYKCMIVLRRQLQEGVNEALPEKEVDEKHSVKKARLPQGGSFN